MADDLVYHAVARDVRDLERPLGAREVRSGAECRRRSGAERPGLTGKGLPEGRLSRFCTEAWTSNGWSTRVAPPQELKTLSLGRGAKSAPEPKALRFGS